MASDKTFLDDQESLRALIEAMPEPDRAEYKGYGALSLESVFPGRKMVVYTLKGGEPIDIEVITFGAFMCDWDNGPSAVIQLSTGESTVLTIPKRLRPRDLFLHIPQNFVLKYKGKTNPKNRVDFVSHYAVLVKTRSKEIHQSENHTYCVTLNQFRERFPDLKIRY